MSEESQQFLEMVAIAYTKIELDKAPKYYCEGCGLETPHIFIGETKTRTTHKEKYRCACCNLIVEYAV